VKTLPAVDVVIVGGGWTGLLMAKELGSRTSCSVVVLERGGPQPSSYAATMDELDYAIRLRMMQDISKETVTLRHSVRERALPIRQYGPFLPGTGVGGGGEHWGGHCFRILPDCFELHSRTVARYGVKRLPEDHAIQDWGISFKEIEPYYVRAERLLGVSGKAGNLKGKPIEGGNIFEGPRSAEYPAPPTKIPYAAALYRDAAKSLGYHPFPVPGAAISTPYTNPDGISRPACVYCGFCERFGCMIGAKAQPGSLLLPVIAKHNNVAIRTGTWARRIVKNQPSGRVRGIQYLDAAGEEVFQPADVAFLASWTLNNTRLLLLSAIGEPYNPSTGKGTLGRNLTHQVNAGAAALFFKQPLNRFMGSGHSGIAVDDLNADFIDHSELPFLRGGMLEVICSGDRPIGNFGLVPPSVKSRWGSEWKKAAIHWYDRVTGIGLAGEHLAYKGNFMDLDPRYKDCHGDPLLRLTLDWRDNERQMVAFYIAKGMEIARAMGGKEIMPFDGLTSYDARHYHSSHIQGGVIMGSTPERSVVNSYLQHWQLPNLFVLGASCFPQNSSANPTLTALALTYRTADAVVDRYLKQPAALA
jgi:gluconate 2-dehydrogenase alpha chain